MPQIVNGAITFDDDDLKWFIEYYGDTEWAVFLCAAGEVLTRRYLDLADDDPANPAHTEETARAVAAVINIKLADSDPVKAVVLRYGVPEAAVA